MNLSSAFDIIGTSFSANAAQSALVAKNIANASTPGYTRETANLESLDFGGVDVVSIGRAANAAQSALVAKNIANASTPGYTRETANLESLDFGGVDVVSIGRAANAALLAQLNDATAGSAAANALLTGLSTISAGINDGGASGSAGNGGSPAAAISALQTALQAYDAAPGDATAGAAAPMRISHRYLPLSSHMAPPGHRHPVTSRHRGARRRRRRR
jgi:flagellar hook-associated protein FlgK